MLQDSCLEPCNTALKQLSHYFVYAVSRPMILKCSCHHEYAGRARILMCLALHGYVCCFLLLVPETCASHLTGFRLRTSRHPVESKLSWSAEGDPDLGRLYDENLLAQCPSCILKNLI